MGTSGGTSRTSDNTKVPDFSFFDLRQIKTWKTEQLAWHGSSFRSASEVRHIYKKMYFSERVIIFTSNGVDVWAGITRYFGEKQRIILVHIT